MGKSSKQTTTQIMREFSSGGVVFKKLIINNEELKILWLIAASAPSKIYPEVVWRLPKGWVDDETGDKPGPIASGRIKADEASLRASAIREVAEEGGIEAKITEKIGTEKYFFNAPGKGKILKFVTFYLMEYMRDLPEGFDGETSEIVWLPFDEAVKKLSFSGEKQMLKKAKELMPL